ncbi:MAG: MBL fold metallo-hydrolase [Planctomycetota bacterium]|jgi:beta-lactamase superfamily II metal-dependent hydrolase
MSRKKKTKRATRKRGPEQVSVTMYDVGFGDCFVVTFAYGQGQERRVLIDCGSTSKKKGHMSRVVDKLVKDCGGHVDAVVATHRHKDHLSAFGLKGLGEKLEALKPEVVIQPWTEHPEAEKAALEAPTVFTSGAVKQMKGLAAAQKFALELSRCPNRILAGASAKTQRYLRRIASLSIPNRKAILCLTRMGKKHAYVHAGGPSGLEKLLPGVRVWVLGPPTLRQSESIRRQTRWEESEFWKLYAGAARSSSQNMATARGRSSLFPRAASESVARAPSYVKWVTRQLDAAQVHNAKRIVRALDEAINNTSVILLFKVGNEGLLFSGDAQLENWEYALADRTQGSRLRKTLLYKVGHHGSTNATPKTLWRLFRRRGARRQRLVTLLSTESGHHNRVPRASLVEALESETIVHSTEAWRNKLSETYLVWSRS